MKRLLLIPLVIVLAISLVLSGCPATAPAEKAILRTSWYSGSPTGLNPFLAAEESAYIFLTPIYEPLCMPLMDGTVQPWIATDWEYNAASMTWTFHLDERAHWSDGEPLTAEDVKFTFETAWENDLTIGGKTKPYIDSIQVIDEHTVAFKMKSLWASMVFMTGAMLIMPKHIWSEVDDVTEYENLEPVGSGPFLVEKWEPRSYIHLVKDPKYWRGPAHIDELIIRVYTEATAQILALQRGEIDIIPDLVGSEAVIDKLRDAPDLKVHVAKFNNIWYWACNMRIYPLHLKEVRQAMSLVVDRQEVIDRAMSGYAGMPLMGYFAPSVEKWANPSLTWPGLDMSQEERVSEANAILDGLGFMPGADGIRVTDRGERMSFEFNVPSVYPSYIRAVEMVKGYCEEIGIEILVMTRDISTLYSGMVFSMEQPLSWDMVIGAATPLPEPSDFVSRWATEKGAWSFARVFGFEDESDEVQEEVVKEEFERFKSLAMQSDKTMDESERWELLQEAQELFADNLYNITMGHRFGAMAHRIDKFTGWNLAEVAYEDMRYPLNSLQNLLSVRPAR